MTEKKQSYIDLISFFNKPGNVQTQIISDYEGEQIPDISDNLLICGDILDSTVGGGGDSSQISVNGSVGGISKNHNLYNIYQVLTKNNIRLLLGNRDLNKLKCLPLCKMKVLKADNKKQIIDFNNGNINLSTETYEKYKTLVKNNDWIGDMNNWLPFWNDTVYDESKNKKVWNSIYAVNQSETPFLDRFNKIFGTDGSVGTMSAGNLLYTIPFEVFGVANVTEDNKKNTDYLAFIVLSVFNAGFNKSDKSDKSYRLIEIKDNLHETYINGLLYRFYKAIGTEKINFIGYFNLEKSLYVFSHGGITSDLIENPKFNDLLEQIKKDYTKITNSEQLSQKGGAIKEFTEKDIIKSLNTHNSDVCLLISQFMEKFYFCMEQSINADLTEYKYMPSPEMLLLMTLSAPYKPDSKDSRFVMRSPINPGIVNILSNGFVCSNATLTQIFGHVPKGFGPTFFTLQNGDKKSYIANIDMSQSFKYSGWAGKTNVQIGFNSNTTQFTLYYVLDISNDTKIQKSNKTNLTNINYKEDNGKYILINTTDPTDKKLVISQTLDKIFENEETLKTELKDKIGTNVILYHGFKSDDKLHIFSLSDFITSFNKVLVLYNSAVPSKTGGYYEKYMKYKTKYIALKNSML